MDYKKIKSDNGFHLYQDSSFNTIFFQIAFFREEGNFEDAAYDILCNYLTRTNKNFENEFELNKRMADLYSIDFGFNTVNIGSKSLLFFSTDMVSPTVVHDDYAKEAFDFAHKILFEPDFTNEEVFENTKKVYLSYMLNSLSQPGIVARNLYERKVFNDKNAEFRFATDEEYITRIIESITLKDIEELYHKTIKDDKFLRCFVFGNIKEEEYEELRKQFKFNSEGQILDYSRKCNITDEDIEIPCDTMSESTIYITYTIDNLDEGTRQILFDIFNGSSDLTREILREKYQLVYSSVVQLSYTGKYVFVRARIDKNNKQQFIEAVDEMIGIVQDKEKIKEYLERAKEAIKTTYYLLDEEREHLISKIDDYVANLLNGFDDVKYVENIDSIEPGDIIKCTKTLKKKNVFMYRGDRNE